MAAVASAAPAVSLPRAPDGEAETVPSLPLAAPAPARAGDGGGDDGRGPDAHAPTAVSASQVAMARARVECVMATSSGT
ncbi:MAG: hypothetical protein ABS52_14815 [Gemmatimonadetes bacterium SCN 70-22]|nr:MAG: hypothetical protein ABS52_14815 [Gemmatimonadetes bacterium SCN 70-22]